MTGGVLARRRHACLAKPPPLPFSMHRSTVTVTTVTPPPPDTHENPVDGQVCRLARICRWPMEEYASLSAKNNHRRIDTSGTSIETCEKACNCDRVRDEPGSLLDLCARKPLLLRSLQSTKAAYCNVTVCIQYYTIGIF
ncbi:hypothetical protein QLX08_007866 [Tetragonisca angustula]|uniref:Uncharacterized protein n=1 Tax=Tetragonisca angustula TaxID=166442 RepID=A0AAW0ZMM9_9HYME